MEEEVFDFKLKQSFEGVATGGTGTGTTGRKVELFSEQGAGFTSLWYNNKGEHPYIEDFGGKRVSVNTFDSGLPGSGSATDFGARINQVTDEVYISYRMWFSDGFDFDSPGTWWNGKLPGFRGKPSIPAGDNGTVNNNGPVIYPNWRGSRNYFWVVYHHGPVSTGGGFGDNMGKGQWGPLIETGRWIDLDMRIVMNTNGVANGILQIWIAGNLITQATVDDVILRKSTSVQYLDEFVYITSTDWDTIIPQTQQLYIADINIWKYQPDYLTANPQIKKGFELWESSDQFVSPLRFENGQINSSKLKVNGIFTDISKKIKVSGSFININ